MDPLIIFVESILLVGGAFFWLYFNKRIGSFSSEVSKIEVMSKKLNEIVDQQKSLARAIEEEKLDVAHSAWSKKEILTMKKEKIEEYMKEAFWTIDFINKNVIRVFDNGEDKFSHLPVTTIPKLMTVQMLYIPEIKEESERFTQKIEDCETALTNYMNKNIDDDNVAEELGNKYELLGESLKELISKLQGVVASLYDS